MEHFCITASTFSVGSIGGIFHLPPWRGARLLSLWAYYNSISAELRGLPLISFLCVGLILNAPSLAAFTIQLAFILQSPWFFESYFLVSVGHPFTL